MKVLDLMTRQVLSVSEDASIFDGIRLMLQNNVSGLPVVNAKGELVGIVTEGDFLRRYEIGTQSQRSGLSRFLAGPGKLATEYVHAAGRRVGEIMTSEVTTIAEDADLADAVAKMEQHHCKRLPVVNGKRLVGIISRSDFLRALIRATKVPAPMTDAAIHDSLVTTLNAERWAMPNMLDVAVKDGVVELNGAITDERMRNAIIVAAENIPGVKSVRDHLAWIEPISGTLIEARDSAAARA